MTELVLDAEHALIYLFPMHLASFQVLVVLSCESERAFVVLY